VPFDSLQTRRRQADSIIVCLEGENGVTGLGESAPRRYVTGEDTASVRELLRYVFSPILFAAEVPDLDGASDTLAQCEAACRQQGIGAYLSALSAVDLALMHSLQQNGCPKEHLYGPQVRRQLRFSASVPFLPLDLIETFFPVLNAKLDISILKILIDDNLEQNTERVKRIRDLAGPHQELRLEANGKLSFKQVSRQLDRLLPLGITAVEQPLPPNHDADLPRLRRAYGIKMIADESLASMDDARRLIETGGCDVFNLKVSKCGGIVRARAVANMAAAHGIRCHIGTHVGETELLGAAGRRIARAIPNFDAYGGGSPVLFSRLFDSRETPAAEAIPDFEDDSEIERRAIEELLEQSHLMEDIRST
jgi:muconate cycloisomerase